MNLGLPVNEDGRTVRRPMSARLVPSATTSANLNRAELGEWFDFSEDSEVGFVRLSIGIDDEFLKALRALCNIFNSGGQKCRW